MASGPLGVGAHSERSEEDAEACLRTELFGGLIVVFGGDAVLGLIAGGGKAVVQRGADRDGHALGGSQE